MKIGTHISKDKTFLKSLRDFYEDDENTDKPCQIFTSSPKFWKRTKLHPGDMEYTKQYVDENNLSVYIHSIYLINLCRSNDEFKEKAFDCLKWELEMGEKLGFKGVVVHCGKSLKLGEDKALENMYENIHDVLDYASESCPLLLETSAGQGTEVCWKYQDLEDFYGIFGEDEMKKIKICIDTCHVFAAGHDPLEFLTKWYAKYPESLVLVHYNDSKEEIGKRKDRHEVPGNGCIGAEKMIAVMNWCNEKNLPMVLE